MNSELKTGIIIILVMVLLVVFVGYHKTNKELRELKLENKIISADYEAAKLYGNELHKEYNELVEYHKLILHQNSILNNEVSRLHGRRPDAYVNN